MGDSRNSSKVIPIEKSFKELKGIFDCSICQSPFKKPTEIQCGHIYCHQCLKELTKSACKTVNCPLCDKKILRRSMVARDDIEDMLSIVERMTVAFNREMQDYVQGKVKSLEKESSPEPVPIVPTPSPSPPDLDLCISGKEVLHVHENKKAVSSSVDKFDKLKKLSQQKYVIMTSSVVPEFSPKAKRHASETAMDLSARCGSVKPVKYVFKEAIKFVKPMDLSMNKKRKLEPDAVSESGSSKNETVSPSKNASPGPLKRSKTAKKSQCLETGTPLNLSSTDATSSRRSSRSKTELANSECIAKTSSDEMLSNLSEDTFIHKVSQTRKTRSSTNKEKKVTKAQVNKKEESETFIFKQPTLAVAQTTQSPKRKNLKKSNSPSSPASSMNNSILNTKKVGVQDIKAAFDDELRDSDLLFLKINDNEIQSGASPKNNPPSSKNETIDVAATADSIDKENTSQDVSSKPKASTPSQSNRRSRTRKTKIAEGSEKAVTTHVHQDTSDLLGDVTWIDDAFSSNESQQNSKNSVEKVNEVDADQGSSKKLKQDRYVFCPTRLTKQQLGKLQQLCKLCNGTILNDYSPDVTHLIINLANGRVPQTLKYLYAIAGKKWVVIFDWVEKCVSTGSVVPEEIFETSNFKQCDPGVKRARLASKALFTNLKFYFATDTFKNMGYSFENVLTLMTALGAEVIPSTEDLDLPNGSDLIIIGDRTANSTDYYNWFLTHDWITVTFNWILDCILDYKLVKLSAKYLCIDLEEADINDASSALQSQSEFCA